MVTEDEILQILSQEPLLSPSESPHKKPIVDRDGSPVLDSNGKQLELPTSYYCSFTNGTQLIIRASNHGTDLDTWVRHNPDPTISLQNVSIVFSNKKSEPELKTEPHEYIDENGNTVKGYRYFVVEEFSYDISNFMKKDVKRIISQLKRLSEFDANSEPVFKDPFKEKPKKRATPEILKPQDKDGKPIPKTTNKVSDRQSKLEESREMNTKVKLSESQLRKIIRESLIRVLQENHGTIEEGKLGRALSAAALGAGLMFGHPQQANAQLNVKQSVQEGPKVIASSFMDWKNLEFYNGVYYLRMATTNRFDDEMFLTLGKNVEQSIRTLNDLMGIVSNKTAMVEISDDNFGDTIIQYGKAGGSAGIGEYGLWFSKKGYAGNAFIHKGTIAKFIKRMEEINPTTFQVSGKNIKLSQEYQRLQALYSNAQKEIFQSSDEAYIAIKRQQMQKVKERLTEIEKELGR